LPGFVLVFGWVCILVSFYSLILLAADGAVCDQKTSKFFVSLREESMARHMGVNAVY
jgi:hypothetical protein